MNIIVFGLTISSTWGNGHATLWRGLCAALGRLGHSVTFFERDVSYYAAARDYFVVPLGELVLYRDWPDIAGRAHSALRSADAAIVTSYCPDALEARELVFGAVGPLAVFYDLDTPVTLAHLAEGETVPYLGEGGLSGFDLVLSYTGGAALDQLIERLDARRVAPLYGHVDPEAHYPVPRPAGPPADLSYMGAYAADRQAMLEVLFLEPARRKPEKRFVIAGAQYPHDFPWTENIHFVRHLPPAQHPGFYASSRLTLNVTRRAMAKMGWCPSGRLFEAAACGCTLLTDDWEGLDAFFAPGQEILVADTFDDALAALDLSDAEIARISAAARERTLAEHSSQVRAEQLIGLLETENAPTLMEA